MSERVIVAITGASGAIYGIRTLELLHQLEVETHLILSAAAKVTISQETDWKVGDVVALASVSHEPGQIAAGPASGSFASRGMIIAPCSIKTLSVVANSYAADLIGRTADVTLKEGRPLLLMVRETPLHRGHLRLLTAAAEAGAIIFPPVPAFYSRPQSIDEIVTATVARALLRLGFDNDHFHRWRGG